MAEIIKTVIDVELNSGQFASQLRSLQQQINAFNLTLNKSQLTQGQAAKFFADELSNAVNSSRFFRAETVKMQTAAAALDSTLRKGQGTLGQFFSAAFNKRSAMAAETFALAAERARTMQTQFVATGKAAKGMQDALAIRPLTAFVSQASIAGQRMQILNSMFKQGTTQLINFGKNVQWAGRQLMVGFTVPLTIFGTTAGKVFMDLEKQVVSFKKVYGDLFTTPAELKQNLEAVQALAAEYTKYGVAVKDTISLAAQAAAAGRQGAELTDAVTAATRLATLGQMDQNAALDATIALQSAFKIGGQELADTINYLNMVENQTVVSLQDIAAAIPRVAPVIKGLGGDVKDLTVFLAAMQEGGVTAEQGANALKSGLASLINPTKAAKETLSGFGINLQKIVDVNRGDLMGTVTTFADALQKLDEFSRQQALEKVFGKFQYARLGALFENIVKDGSQANQVLETMGYSTEELRMTAEKELNTISQSFGVQLIAAMEKFKLAIAPIGELFVKMAIPIVQFITKLANWFTSLPEGVKNIAAIATVITGVVVPAATMMFGLFMNLVGTLAKMSQGAAIFGATLLKKGPVAALKTLSQSTKYLSLAEIDAANSARQLGSATGIANAALLEQVGAATSANTAIRQLTNSYQMLIAQQLQAGSTQPLAFGAGKSASEMAKSRPKARIKAIGLNRGNIVPGVGNTDTVPAMLTPGEFVVNKEATQNNLELLKQINEGSTRGYSKGGRIYLNTGSIEPIPAEPFRIGRSTVEIPSQLVQDSIGRDFEKFAWSGGRNKPDFDKKSYKAYQIIKSQLNNNPSALREFITKVQEKASRNNNSIRTSHIKEAAAPYIREMGLDIDAILDYTDKAHLSSKIATLQNPLSISGGRTIPAGTPIQFLNNRVLDIRDNLNKQLSKEGVPASKLKKYLELPGKKQDIFKTMNYQFTEYVKQLGLQGDEKTSLMNEYKSAQKAVYKSYIDDLGNNLNKTVSDHGHGGTLKLEKLTQKAFENFQSNPKLKEFDDIISLYTNARVAPLHDMARELHTSSGGKAGSVQDIVKKYKLDKLGLLKEVYKTKGYDLNKDPLKGFIDSVTTQGSSKPKFAQRQYDLDAPYVGGGKFGVLSNLANKLMKKVLFRHTEMMSLGFNKGGMIPGVKYLNTGGRLGKAIFERGKVGKPELMKGAYGLDKFSENDAIEMMQAGFSTKDAGSLMKNLQKGKLSVNNKRGPIKNIDELIEREIEFEYSQKTLTSKLAKEIRSKKYLSKSQQQKEIDNYNKQILGLNKGGMIPGVQYLNTGGMSTFTKNIGSRLSNIIPPSLLPKREYKKLVNSIYQRKNVRTPGEFGDDLIPTYKIGGSSFAFQGKGDDFSQLASKGITPINTNPQSLLESAIKLNPKDKNLQTMLENIKNKKFGPKEIRLLDDIASSTSVGRRGSASINENVDGFAMVLASLSGNKNAQRIVNEKTNALKQIFANQAAARKAENAKTSWGNFSEIGNPADIPAFHSSKYPIIRDADGNITLQTHGYHTIGTNKSVPRSSLHFSLEAPVKSHLEGAWNVADNQVVTKLSSIMDNNGLPVNLNAIDTWWMANPGQGLKLSEASVVRPIKSKSQYNSELINRGLINPGQKSSILTVDPKTKDVLYLIKKDYRPSDRTEISRLSKELELNQFSSSDGKVISLRNPESFKGYENEVLDLLSTQLAKKQLNINSSPTQIDGWQINDIAKNKRIQSLNQKYSIRGGIHAQSRAELLEASLNKYDIPKTTKFFGESIEAMRTSVASGSFGENIIKAKNNQKVALNKGNIVPGVGNTDTVPAMLTPGEFVVNKDATQKNLGLLHAINAQKLNVGGKVITQDAAERFKSIHGVYPQGYRPPTFRGAGPLAMGVGVAASLPFMGQGAQEQFGPMGAMAASMVAWIAAQSLATKAFTGLTKNVNAGAKGLGAIGKGGQAIQKQFVQMRKYMGFFKMSNPYVLAIVAATAAVVGFTKLHDNMKQAVSKYNNALYGTSESLENIAKAMGRTTPGQREAQRTSELISGQRATEEEKAMSSQLMNSAEGKSMLQDLQTVKKMGGDQAEALRNQLTQSIMAGVLTPAEARQVATDIGIALKNEKVGIDAVAQITQLVGPEGELIKGNRIEILSQIMAPTNLEDIRTQVDKELKRIDDAPFWNIFSKSYDFGLAMQQVVKVFTDDDVLAAQMEIETLQNNTIQNILKEKEVRAALNEERIKGDITFLEYEKEIAKLNTAGRSLGIKQQLDALNAGDLQFNAAAGAFGSGKNPFRNIGAKLTNAGFMESNAPGFLQDPLGMFYKTDREKKTIAAEDLANKVTRQFDTQLSDMGMDDAARQDLMKFVTDEFGGNLADQAIFFGDILSGKMNLAAVTFIQEFAKADPEFQKIIDKYGLTETAAAFSPLGTSETLMTEASQGLSKKSGEEGAMNLAQVEQLGTNYEKLQALPPEITKSLKLNIESSVDVNRFGPITEDLRRNWDILSALNPQLNKELVFSLIAVDSNKNPRTPEQIEKDAIRLNKAMSDLASGTKQEKAKAQLELVALYNGKDINDPKVQENLNQLKKDITGFDDFDAGTQAKLIEIDSQIDAKGLLIAQLEGKKNRSSDEEEEYQQLLRERAALEKDLISTSVSARIAGAGEAEKGEESAFQKTKKSFEETKKYQKAIVQLTKQGVSGENIALVDQASLLEMSTSERKKAIGMMKQQQDIQKTLSVMLLSDEEQRIRLQQNAVKIKDKEISNLNRQIEDVERLNRVENQRIDKLQRQNELDNRQTELRNKALQGLAEKEKTVNSAYDLRSKALDKVAQINDRLAQQQQDRIALAGALTSGDFGAAASAAATMSSNFGANQLQDAKSALETQREKELSSLTAEVNGQLFTRAEIEQQIDDINERVYQRNLSIQSLQDTIFNREQELEPIRDAVFAREGERLQLARDLEDAEYNKWKTEMDGINASILKWNEYWKAKRGQGGKALKDEYVKASSTGKKPKANSFGGFVRAAYGGMINYRGSKEAPPSLRANLGMEVPGIGMTDKVPALLTPGEFVVRKSVAQANLPLLKSLNSNVFPESQDLTASPQISAIDNSVSTVSAPVYNNYSVNVNVADTDASANDIASAVMSRIKMAKGRSIRGNRV